MSTERHTKAAELANVWLRGEDGYQFAKSDGLFRNHAARLESIMEQEMPQRWHRYRVFRDNHVPDQAAQQLMKVVGAARAAVTVSAHAQGMEIEEAQLESWRPLETFDPTLNTENLRQLIGSRTLRQAFDGLDYVAQNHLESAQSGLVRAMGLAVTHLVIEDERTGAMRLPMPGRPSGELLEWEPDPPA